MPLPDGLLKPRATDPEFVDRNGIPLRDVHSTNGFHGRIASLQEVPDALVRATLAAEDKRFWSHHGLDWRASARAALGLVRNGRVVSGASTISQQVIKLAEPRPRTLRTKLIEAAQAMRLEQVWSKERILTEYFNRLDFGNRRFGVVAGADFYFGKPPSDLSEGEAALLAGLPQSPTRLNPHTHFERAKKRQEWILGREHAEGWLKADDVVRATGEQIRLQAPRGNFRAPHFVDLLLLEGSQRSRRFDNGEGEAAEISGDPGEAKAKRRERRVPSAPIVHTTLDLPLNDFVQRSLGDQLARLQNQNARNGAVVVIENRTGNVLALVGSDNFFAPDDGQVNGAVALRSAGSTFKPFTYLLALERGASPASIVADVPVEFPTSTGIFAPLNYDRRCYGPMRYRLALANSLNISAVRVLDSIGGPAVLRERLEECGLTTLKHPAEYYGLGLTIGNAEARLLELANAYAGIARMGEFKPVQLVEAKADLSNARPHPGPLPRGEGESLGVARNIPGLRFTDALPNISGRALTAPSPGGEGRGEGGRPTNCLFAPAACFLIADMLNDNHARSLAFGANSSLRFDFPVACKTGTSSDFRDNWALGFTPEFTVGVWVGNFDGSPMRAVSGVSGAAPVLHEVFAQLHQRFGTSWFATPTNIVERWVHPVTGKLVAANHPGAVREKFLASNLPAVASPDDYDPLGHVRLPAEYREWLASGQNWLTGQAVAAEANDGNASRSLSIVSPPPGTTYFLDPDLPAQGSKLRLQANAKGTVHWRSNTLNIQQREGSTFAIMSEGRHELIARDEQTGAESRTWISVKPL